MCTAPPFWLAWWAVACWSLGGLLGVPLVDDVEALVEVDLSCGRPGAARARGGRGWNQDWRRLLVWVGRKRGA